MDIFLEKHQESILGVIEGFDRIIFKGHLTSMFPDGAFGRYLYKRGVLLKDAGKFFESETEVLIQHAKRTAEQAGRPYRYLESAHTHASGQSKEAMARAIAEQDGVTEGLVFRQDGEHSHNAFGKTSRGGPAGQGIQTLAVKVGRFQEGRQRRLQRFRNRLHDLQ